MYSETVYFSVLILFVDFKGIFYFINLYKKAVLCRMRIQGNQTGDNDADPIGIRALSVYVT
ncbi:hypothetical protein A593_18390 [Klebsiella variicola]|nr:hypothetical protein A593_18390 [Klebsiella variicola]